ncbi:hypothetical protein NQ117_16815 [Paenibacillus sp. SC116]|uniref:hypothetical protein n=1 Tax=Paenibacillus sp. SC116 TaxID=2968986 RepID=UPI00215B2545|nr:hypothetical protein [Paenibacillus sp. SC116]MCR8845345.1 hypothetical protein [Paenibacillus sp. SC116]
MKYKYEIINTRKDGSHFKKIKLPIELSPVEVMLYDMEGFSNPIFIEHINEVLSGKVDFRQHGGNIVDLEIRRDFTTVCNLFPRDKEVECIIETEELLKIIELWIDINRDLLRDFN